MRRPTLISVVLVALALAVVPAATGEIQLTPVKRLSFPERAYLLDLGRDAAIGHVRARLQENGAAVKRFTLQPLAASSLDSAVVLAVDASDSMAGRPFASAIAAVRSFATSRAASERIGVVAFNDSVRVVQAPTASSDELGGALDHSPTLAYGTHIYDAVMRSLALLSDAHARAGAIILLSDGSDVGSTATLAEAVSAAVRQRVRVFTVGLRSKTFDAAPLQELAGSTGASYAEASSAMELADIYTSLGRRLSSQYVLRYRSAALAGSSVTVRLAVDGVGAGATDYTAPAPGRIAPYHRSPLKQFMLSFGPPVLISLAVALMVAALLGSLLARRRSGLVGRVGDFLQSARSPTDERKERGRHARGALVNAAHARGRVARLERTLEIARIEMSAARVIALTASATVLLMLLLALVSPLLCAFGVIVPLTARALINTKLRSVRNAFAEQLPPNLQVLASAMRSGHSLSGALAVMLDNADEPSHAEFGRVVSDDRLGVAIDESLRRVAERMSNRDLDQVALISELQRTSGGNAAEVLDTVVETIRERAEIRRLLRTLTAQGRMGRWILTALPVVVAGLLTVIQPDVMRPLFTTTAGFAALTLAGLMVVAGSLVIQKIVDIEV